MVHVIEGSSYRGFKLSMVQVIVGSSYRGFESQQTKLVIILFLYVSTST